MGVARADAPAQVEPVEPRHHHVEQAQSRGLLGEGAPGRLAVFRDDAVDSLQREQVNQPRAQIGIVFRDENFHPVPSGVASIVARAQRPGSAPPSAKPPPLARANSCTIDRPSPCDGLFPDFRAAAAP